MRLVLSGGWFCREGLFEAKIGRVHFFESLEDLRRSEFGFLVLSYSLSSQTLGVRVKSSGYPAVVYLELEDIFPFHREPKTLSLEQVSSSLSAQEYMGGVERVRGLISEGILYQLNLTCRFDFLLEGSPLDLFVRYYQRQPVPYAFFLELECFYLMSGSMELFLQKKGEILESRPIKGTARLKKDLIESEKDRAENLMITDMVRNDLSRVANPRSVEVVELFKVEEFKTLFHMHSTVRARTSYKLPKILLETFPPASVVGAPKRKAVEVIDQLEPHSRDYYCGAGGIVMGEDFTLSVLIRTALGSANRLSYYAGAGIVWDSLPEKEWQEVLLKTRAFQFHD